MLTTALETGMAEVLEIQASILDVATHEPATKSDVIASLAQRLCHKEYLTQFLHLGLVRLVEGDEYHPPDGEPYRVLETADVIGRRMMKMALTSASRLSTLGPGQLDTHHAISAAARAEAVIKIVSIFDYLKPYTVIDYPDAIDDRDSLPDSVRNAYQAARETYLA